MKPLGHQMSLLFVSPIDIVKCSVKTDEKFRELIE